MTVLIIIYETWEPNVTLERKWEDNYFRLLISEQRCIYIIYKRVFFTFFFVHTMEWYLKNVSEKNKNNAYI